MRHVYVNLPHYEGIAKELNNHYKLCSKNEAHAIVTEYPDEFIDIHPFMYILVNAHSDEHAFGRTWGASLRICEYI